MSQVKNLRAMFENKGDDPNPPDRGRSPASFGSNRDAGSNASESPRPLSTVRTSFVAIEKHGRIGLRRDHSYETSPSGRAASNEADAESVTSALTDDVGRASRKLFLNETIPESPRTSTIDANIMVPDHRDGGVALNKSTSGTKKVAAWINPSPTGSVGKGTSIGEQDLPHGDFARRSMLTSGDAHLAEEAPAAQNRTQPVRTYDKAQKQSQNTDNTDNTVVESAPRTSRAPAVRQTHPVPSRAQPRASVAVKSYGAGVGSSVGQKPGPIKISKASETGFVKPKPKSPTKPVNLPPSLMAPTASSVSKGTAHANKRAAGLSAAGGSDRPVSRVGANGPVTGRTIRRQPSSINGSRPSVGPPPRKSESSDMATGQKEKQVDESFLARMMRPTQSSSSKTSAKAPSTPPKRAAQRQVTSGTTGNSRLPNGARRTGKAAATAHSPTRPSSDKQVSDAAVEAEFPGVEVLPGAFELDSDTRGDDNGTRLDLEGRTSLRNRSSALEQQIATPSSGEQLNSLTPLVTPPQVQDIDEQVSSLSPKEALTGNVLPDQPEQVTYSLTDDAAEDAAILAKTNGSATDIRLSRCGDQAQPQEDTASMENSGGSVDAPEEAVTSNLPIILRSESRTGQSADDSPSPSVSLTAAQQPSEDMAGEQILHEA